MKMNFLRPSMTPDQRLDWMDIARGMGMIMVVYGHSYGPENRYFYLFHMPLFFILSGYLYNEQHSFGQYFVKKLTSLYIPFAGWNLIVMLTRLVWADQNGFLTPELLEGRLENIRNMLLTVGKDGSYMGATWFLGSLFVISIAYKLVDMLVPAIKFRQIFIFLIFGGVAVYGFFVTIPNMQSRTLILGFFFALGRFMKLHEESFEHFTSPILAVLVIALFWVISNFTEADMGSNVYTNAPLFVVCAILGSLATITLAMCLERWSFRFAEVFRWPLRLIGKNTMDIMIWHFIAFRFVVAYQLYLEGTPLIQVFEVDSRYCTDGLWWLVYFAAGIIIPLIWGWFLKIGPWGWLLKKLRLVSA
jgi:fucose 4-O-acetylase-like acetyltransferase